MQCQRDEHHDHVYYNDHYNDDNYDFDDHDYHDLHHASEHYDHNCVRELYHHRVPADYWGGLHVVGDYHFNNNYNSRQCHLITTQNAQLCEDEDIDIIFIEQSSSWNYYFRSRSR